jgi:ferritin
LFYIQAYYFDREDVALPGFHNFFKKSSDEEREHAEKFMKYQNKRGGRIVLQPVAKPTRDEWSSPLEAVTAALELEKTVNQVSCLLIFSFLRPINNKLQFTSVFNRKNESVWFCLLIRNM